MATIQGIYIALFGRPADPAGLAYFNGVTKNGSDLSGITNLAGQKEYTDRFAGQSNTQIINSIYQSLFGRDGEQTGVDFWVSKLASGSLTINNIAIAILDGAQGSDKAIIDAKIAAADLLTSHLDLPVEQAAYNASTVALAKTYISSISATHPGTGPEVDAVIARMLTSAGQGPAGGGDTTTGTPVAFSATIDQDGHLKFAGVSGNSVSVTVVDSHLVFTNAGHTATLADVNTDISGVQHGITLVSENDDSRVIARDDGEVSGWHFVDYQVPFENGDKLNLDLVDFYSAVGNHSSVLLTSDFNTTLTDADFDMIAAHPELQGLLSGIISNPLNALETISAHLNISVAAADGATTSLNPTITNIVDYISEKADVDLSYIENQINFNVGLPIILSGGAHEAHADSGTGFTLVGNWNTVVQNLTAAPEGHVAGSNDILVGGSGDDILVGLDDNGAFKIGPVDSAPAARIIFDPSDTKISFSAGDILTGGEGKDIFVHIEAAGTYSDGVDLITDFKVGEDKIAILSNVQFSIQLADLDNDGQVNDSLITFHYGDGPAIPNQAIGVSNVEITSADIIDLLGVNNHPDVTML